MAALKITGQSAAPTPVTASDKGTLYYDSDTNKLRHYNGTAWADVSAALTSADLPAGSVLQVQQFEVTETNVLTATFENLWENALTKKSASSDVFVFVSGQVQSNGGGAGGGFGMKIYRKSGAGVALTDTAVWTKTSLDAAGPESYYDGGYAMAQYVNCMAKDVISGVSAETELFYGLFAAKKISTGVVSFPADEVTDGFISMILMEVQK